jgi:hypothetical protein
MIRASRKDLRRHVGMKPNEQVASEERRIPGRTSSQEAGAKEDRMKFYRLFMKNLNL